MSKQIVSDPIPLKKRSGDEPIIGTDNGCIGDFWAWAYSDLLSNRNRAIFAEFLVALALEITTTPRIEWDAVDLYYQDKTIEVKSAAYLQSWQQAEKSAIRFNIAKTKAWYQKTNTYADIALRTADCYVFCLFAAEDRQTANVIDTNQWQFFVLSTAEIDQTFGEQKSIVLSRIKALTEAVNFDQLQERIEAVLGLAD